MNRLIVSLVLVLACIAACKGFPDSGFPFGRIVNGEDTTIEAHPYQVSIQRTDGSHFCGGSLINENIVVTAAHCLQRYKASQMQVRLGSTSFDKGGEVVSVKAFKFHEDYDSKRTKNDVGVIKLSSPVRLSAKIRTIRLAKESPKSGTPAVVSGWGTKCYLICGTSATLQYVELSLIDKNTCGSELFKYGNDRILDTMICAYAEKKDACQGDSGGPLVANGELVGIVSWGDGCAWTSYPGVYAEVAALRSWIEKTAAAL